MRVLLLLALLLAGPQAGQAQPRPAAPVTGFNPAAASVQEQQLLREPGRVSLPDEGSAPLIQPMARTWRWYERDLLPVIAAVCVPGMLVVLTVFFAIRGRVRILAGRARRSIRRFTPLERFIHWLAACSWCVLALSGLTLAFGRDLLLPVLDPADFSAAAQAAKYVHDCVSFPFVLGLALILLRWVWFNIPGRTDIAWLRAGGGLLGEAPPARKFNAGQKAIFWLVVLGGGTIAATGYVMLFPFSLTGIGGQQAAQVVHGVLAMLMIAAMLAHIYLGTVGMEGAFAAMGSGWVDLNWARAHHSVWVREQEARYLPPAE